MEKRQFYKTDSESRVWENANDKRVSKTPWLICEELNEEKQKLEYFKKKKVAEMTEEEFEDFLEFVKQVKS